MGSSFRAFVVGAAALCLALPAFAHAAPWSGNRPAAVPGATWVAPTPAEGARLEAVAGRQLSVALGATAPGAPAVSVMIRAVGLPPGAAFQPRDGNPASASVNWLPSRSLAGRSFPVTFTAQPSAPGMPAATRRVTLVVRAPAPKPKPKPRRKPERFVLSSEKQHLYRYAFVLRQGVARSAPRKTGAVVGSLGRWTPEGTTNLVLTLDGRRTKRGVWIRVRLATLPNSRTGWVPRRMLSDWKELRTRLVVDRRRLNATLYRRGKVVFRAPVGVGQSRWPTPRGEFYIRNQLYGFGNPVYGPIAFGTSARSAVLTDWPGGGFIGLHGTNQPSILPGRVSHGCIRMRNGDIVRLARLMPVGTPLTVR
ncbi:MAG TPA: L,D-transpeptidase family protein [Gaiellaceae bacterium]|nr:L,D-transpeptidase family protein [Gaiellaceae bacterium]